MAIIPLDAFAMFSESKYTRAGYLTLNAIRVLNIISLLLVVVASWIMLVLIVKTSSVGAGFVPIARCPANKQLQFFFFDAVSHFITSSVGLFLVVSEVSLFRAYFAKHWPMLSPESGFVFLGMTMMVLGCNILGNLNKDATSVENLGLPVWRLVISSGVLTTLMGFFNIVAVRTQPLFVPPLQIQANQTSDLRLLRLQTWHHGPASSQRRRLRPQGR